MPSSFSHHSAVAGPELSRLASCAPKLFIYLSSVGICFGIAVCRSGYVAPAFCRAARPFYIVRTTRNCALPLIIGPLREEPTF